MSDLASGLASTANAAPTTETPSAPAPVEAPAPQAERPSTWDDAFAMTEPEAAPDPTPTATAGEVPTIAEPPGAEAGQATAPEKTGPIPFDVHKTALENARKKAAEESIAQFQQQYGGHLQLAQAMQADPVGTITQLVAELQQHPQYGQQLRSHAAKVLGQRQQPKAEEPQPDLVGRDANGQEVTFYSAEQARKWQQWSAQQMRQQLTQEFAPVMEIAKEREAERAKTQLVAQAMDGYKPYVAEIQSMPGFSENKAEIIARQQELFKESIQAGTPVDPMALVMRAYREIVPAKLQAQQQQQQQKQQQDLVASAVAKSTGRTDNPAATAPAPPRRPRSFEEAFEQAFTGYQG